MDPIPETWPPAEDEPTASVFPLFALPNVWLFPYVILPLHVFEERYKQMIEDHLDRQGRIVLGTVREGHEGEMDREPPIYDVAGLGEIGRHERLDDGRFNILLVGLHRVRVRVTESDRLYRRVEAEPAPEISVPRERRTALRKELIDAILERTEDISTIPPKVTLSHLADLLVLRLPLPHVELQRMFEELDVEKRSRAALVEHATRPKKGD